MNEILRIERDLYINKDKLNKQLVNDITRLIDRVKQLEKDKHIVDKSNKELSDEVRHLDSLIRDMEEEYRTLCEKCNKDV